MRILNKTKKLLTISGSYYNKTGPNDIVKSVIKIKLSPGVNEVSKEDYNSVNKSYIDELAEADMLEILGDSKQEVKRVKQAKRKYEPKLGSVDNAFEEISIVD